MGRRIEVEDQKQIKRWHSFSRHIGAIKKHCEPYDFSCRKNNDKLYYIGLTTQERFSYITYFYTVNNQVKCIKLALSSSTFYYYKLLGKALGISTSMRVYNDFTKTSQNSIFIFYGATYVRYYVFCHHCL